MTPTLAGALLWMKVAMNDSGGERLEQPRGWEGQSQSPSSPTFSSGIPPPPLPLSDAVSAEL